jgi:[acyl-carrier-protein] S-malonyltransferase
MGSELYAAYAPAREKFTIAERILGFDIAKIMFEGSKEDLTQTSVTQPAIFLHSVLLAQALGLGEEAAAVAGHSLGEFSALVVAGSLTFEEGLTLVRERANAMQMACDLTPSAMAAIINLTDEQVEQLCAESNGEIVPANYNCPGQLVVSGSVSGIEAGIVRAKALGAKLAVRLPVNGAFHSPFMEPARARLKQAIDSVEIRTPRCPIYQNVTGLPETAPVRIREQLNTQLTSPVRWTQTIRAMHANGITSWKEIGPGTVLKGLIKKIVPEASVESISQPA